MSKHSPNVILYTQIIKIITVCSSDITLSLSIIDVIPNKIRDHVLVVVVQNRVTIPRISYVNNYTVTYCLLYVI